MVTDIYSLKDWLYDKVAECTRLLQNGADDIDPYVVSSKKDAYEEVWHKIDEAEFTWTHHLVEDLKNVICPQCKKSFRLVWDDQKITLVIRGCPSGGIYDVRIECPHCDYEEEL